MSLLTEIQEALMQEGPLGPVILKLRFLAARLGSNLLEEWIKYESDGYPSNAETPGYRQISVVYMANFSGPFGSGIKNAPIPPYLISTIAGDDWNKYEFRESISSLESIIGGEDSGSIQFSASNLIFLLQGKVYEGMACNSVTGIISRPSIVGILSSVRTRILELTLELEKNVPSAQSISIGGIVEPKSNGQSEAVTHIAQQTVYGNVTTITNSGSKPNFQLSIKHGDMGELSTALSNSGIDADDAAEFALIVASETPESREEPFGPRAKDWIAKNIVKAANGTWKAGVAITTQVLTEAALKFYGLK